PGTRVGTLILEAAAEVGGEGEVGTARVSVPGSILEQRPERLELAAGVTVRAGGRVMDEGYAGVSVPAGGGGGGGGGGTVMSIAIAGRIAEGSEEGGQIQVSLSGGSFAPILTLENWTVANLPAGVTAGRVDRVDSRHAIITLTGSRSQDYDQDITEVAVTCAAAEVTGASAALTVGRGVTLAAVDDAESISISGCVYEGSEASGAITVEISGGSFASSLTLGNWTVANLPAGVTVGEVYRDSPTRARLKLQGSAGDFDRDITNVTVSCGAEEYQDNEGGGELSDLDGGFTFVAANEPAVTVSVEWRTPPGTGGKKEGMDGEVIRVRLNGGFFVRVRIDGISLEGTAVTEAGISKESAVWEDAGTVDIHLKWDGSDYGSDRVLTVRVPADAYVDSNGEAISGGIICPAG
ncbi:MAG: hypothetical protein QHH02_08940, partial [Syntrophomonadaceae bacterium]|nr:hypothetical protein [Syntrophomonadaceae bacterium]